MFLLLLKTDLHEGLRSVIPWLAVTAALALVTGMLFPLVAEAAGLGFDPAEATVGDYLAFPFSGLARILWQPSMTSLKIPAAWLAFCALAFYVPLWYPYRDLMGFGQKMIVQAGSRSMWWLAKACWTVVVAVLWLVAVATPLFFCALIGGGKLSLTVSPYTLAAADVDLSALVAVPQDATAFFITMAIMFVALSLVQLTLSLILRPIAGFSCSMAILVFSLLMMSPYLPGEYLIAARSSLLAPVGFDAQTGFWLAVGLVVGALVVGCMTFKTMDILDKEYS